MKRRLLEKRLEPNPELYVSSECWTFVQTDFQRLWERLGRGLAEALLVTLEPGLGEVDWLERDATSWSEQSSASGLEGRSWLTVTLQKKEDLTVYSAHLIMAQELEITDIKPETEL